MEDPVAYATAAGTVKPRIPPLLCPHCGLIDVPLLGPGAGKHVARALCSGCGRYLKWLPKALLGLAKEEPRMDCLNLCLCSGYLERDPSVRYREDGTAHCTCTLRVEEVREGTCYKTYVLAEAYGKTGEALAELHGGAVVLVQGKLFWRKQVTASGAEKSGLALQVQKVSPWGPTPALGGTNP